MSSTTTSIKKTRVSYFVPAAILSDVKDNMNKNGYDLKGKSKWIAEAIHSLLSIENYSELVSINEQMNSLEKLDSISIEKELKQQIDLAVLHIRKNYPTLEGVQSKILRTAIVQRLLR